MRVNKGLRIKCKMKTGLQDFNLREQDTRLVLFGSTVFKIKFRASPELREAVRAEGKERIVQRDIKRATLAILSTVVTSNTLPLLRTDTVAVYTGDCPWNACDKLYFAHHNQPLTPHPHVILMLASLPPTSPVRLGKHQREVSSGQGSPINISLDDCSTVFRAAKMIRVESDETNEESSFVPDPSAASLPGEEGRVALERHVVKAAVEHSKKRLHQLSKPSRTDDSWGKEQDEKQRAEQQFKAKEGKSLFQYLKGFFGWN